MLYKFKSPAGADVIMNQGPAEHLLEVIGKAPGATGIITLVQIPAALEALRAEIKREEQERQNNQAAADDAQDHDDNAPEGDRINFAQRVTPFIRLLELTQAEGKSVVWGV